MMEMMVWESVSSRVVQIGQFLESHCPLFSLAPIRGVEIQQILCSCCHDEWHFYRNKCRHCMFSRHWLRVQTRSGRNSLTFTTSLTGWVSWILRCGQRTAKNTRNSWARESLCGPVGTLPRAWESDLCYFVLFYLSF